MTKQTPHVILTRFNLAIKFDCLQRFDSNVPSECPWLDEHYLASRFEIFEKYTFPSFLNQTDQNFEWIVMFHKKTPDSFKNKIDELSRKMKQFTAWYLDDDESINFGNYIKNYLQMTYPNSDVITTRVDNDDYVHQSFIESIKKDFFSENHTDITILTYPNGLQYDCRTKEILSYNYVNNHFLSMYAPSSNCGTHILMYNHAYIDNLVNSSSTISKREINISPLWIEIITETNFSNAPRWRFSTIYVPFNTKEQFPLLELNWKSKPKYIINYLTKIIKVFIYRGKGLFRLICG